MDWLRDAAGWRGVRAGFSAAGGLSPRGSADAFSAWPPVSLADEPLPMPPTPCHYTRRSKRTNLADDFVEIWFEATPPRPSACFVIKPPRLG